VELQPGIPQGKRGKAATKRQFSPRGGPAWQSRNRISEYLPQRRQGRKGRRLRVKIIRKNFYLSPLNLATLPFDFTQGGEVLEPRLGGRNFRPRVLSASRSFAHAAQILNYSSTKDTKEEFSRKDG